MDRLRLAPHFLLAMSLIGCSGSNSSTGGGTGSFTLSTTQSTLSVTQGSSAAATIAVYDVNAFSGSVTLAASGLPTGVTATFATNPTTGNSIVTFVAAATSVLGPALVTITGTSGGLTATTSVTLTVKATGSFTLAPTAPSVSIAVGASNDDAIVVSDVSPFAGTVTIAASGLPTGVTASYTTNTGANNNLGITFTASSAAPTGTATITVTGTSASLSATTTIALTVIAPQTALSGPFAWTTSGPQITAIAPGLAVKDASAVYYKNQWIVYASSVDTNGDYGIEYLNFTDWSQAAAATPYYLNSQSTFNGYHTAPQVFYFAPQNKWYLIYQSGQPQFSTNDDPTQPQNWTAPQNLLNEPSGSTWLDYWVICDSANCYLFFCGDNGNFYRSSTPIGSFPNGFGPPIIVLSEQNAGNLFEADNVYKIAGANLYMAIIECFGPTGNRYFRAFTASSLDGDWTPLNNASSWNTPFLGLNNVTFASGVTPWTSDFSSGGLVPSYDQTDQIDPTNLQFVFQGDNTATYPAGTSYNLIPWQIGLATQRAP